MPKRTILAAHRGMLGLRAWGDGLTVVLFEFLDDDTKLAQSCRNSLYVQHWYTVVPDPTMRVTLWALMGGGKDCESLPYNQSLGFFFACFFVLL